MLASHFFHHSSFNYELDNNSFFFNLQIKHVANHLKPSMWQKNMGLRSRKRMVNSPVMGQHSHDCGIKLSWNFYVLVKSNKAEEQRVTQVAHYH